MNPLLWQIAAKHPRVTLRLACQFGLYISNSKLKITLGVGIDMDRRACFMIIN
jgi:hypothetical protein